MSEPLRVAVLTVSDRSFRGEREDRGGPAVANAAPRLHGKDRRRHAAGVGIDVADVVAHGGRVLNKGLDRWQPRLYLT